MVTDPVCGMEFKPEEAAAQAEYRGRTYYFCSEACKREFERNPPEYVKATPEQGSSGMRA
jgi:YHS domain-containing protein